MLRTRYTSGLITLFLLSVIFINAEANQEEGYRFSDFIEIPHTSIKDQGRTGTCWDFATISFLESEAMRKNELDSIDLAEMYPVRWTYVDKARNYVRLHGNTTFGQGGQAHDVLMQMEDYGLVPEKAFQSYRIDEEFNHREVADILRGFLNGLLDGRTITNKKWLDAYNAVLNVYFGDEVESFNYNGKQYTPHKFMDEFLKLDPQDYIEIVSCSHKPFYEQVRLEVPDNWNFNDKYYNVPVDEMQKIVDVALDKGYSVCWDADVSDEYFDYQDTCVAFVPRTEPEDEDEDIKLPAEEKQITREIRQKAYNTFNTTDDHLMHIVGAARDQRGNNFYKIKNSWGTDSKYEGYYYISVPYFKLRTINIMVNKEVLQGQMKRKLGIQTGLF